MQNGELHEMKFQNYHIGDKQATVFLKSKEDLCDILKTQVLEEEEKLPQEEQAETQDHASPEAEAQERQEAESTETKGPSGTESDLTA